MPNKTKQKGGEYNPFKQRVIQASGPKPSEHLPSLLQNSKAAALVHGSIRNEIKSKKTRCNNNKRVPWYRKTIPMSRDITFKLIDIDHEQSINGNTRVLDYDFRVKVTWKSDEYNKNKTIIGKYIPIGKDSFKVVRYMGNNKKHQNKITSKEKLAEGLCYKFNVGEKARTMIDEAIKNAKTFMNSYQLNKKHLGY